MLSFVTIYVTQRIYRWKFVSVRISKSFLEFSRVLEGFATWCAWCVSLLLFFSIYMKKIYVVCLPRSLHNLKKTFVPEIVLIHCKMKVFYVFPIGYLSVRWSQFPLVYISEFCYREYTLYFVIMKSISWFCCKSDADTVTVLVTFQKRRVSNPAIYSS